MNQFEREPASNNRAPKGIANNIEIKSENKNFCQMCFFAARYLQEHLNFFHGLKKKLKTIVFFNEK